MILFSNQSIQSIALGEWIRMSIYYWSEEVKISSSLYKDNLKINTKNPSQLQSMMDVLKN